LRATQLSSLFLDEAWHLRRVRLEGSTSVMQVQPNPPSDRAATYVPLAVIGVLLTLRCLAVFQLQADSDEAQHLHVIYGWLGGELPYRDRFDNHTPLLYLIFLPLAAIAGETPQIVLLARIAQFPISLAMLGLIYLIGRRLADREVALWTLATTLAWGDWSLKSVEFRPDVLWSCLWFLAIFMVAKRSEELGIKRFFVAGVSLGAALCTSIKTTFLVPALVLGWTAAWFFCIDLRRALPFRRAASCTLAVAAGFLVVPATLLGWLHAEGVSLETLKFCLFEANRADSELGRTLMTPLLGAIALWLAWRMKLRGAQGPAVAIFLSVSAYTVALIGFSPELRKQTLLPVYPLLILFAWQNAADRLRRHRPGAMRRTGLAVCSVALIYLVLEGRLWEDGLHDQRELLRDTLKLTRPGDFLMDRKGETIFRRRPVYLVYQHATKRAIEEGRLADPDPAMLTKTGTAVAIGELKGLTDSMRRFIRKNYLPAGDGRLRVAGRSLLFYEESGRLAARAPMMIPGEYVALKGDAVVQRTSVPQPGWHDVDLGGEAGPASLFWKPAWDAGFRPLKEERMRRTSSAVTTSDGN
jgi:Dolichyl-phosphate-mannose-protein mannosyltransferase